MYFSSLQDVSKFKVTFFLSVFKISLIFAIPDVP